MFSKLSIPALFFPLTVFSAIHNVAVGGNQQLVFNPTEIFALPGDTVRYYFLDLNHTVTAGDPTTGCNPSGEFNSGFVPVASASAATVSKPNFSVRVQNFEPVTVYCAQAQHCQNGMVMVINPTIIGATSLTAYRSLCAAATANVPAQRVNGGVLRNVNTTGNTGAANAGAGNAGSGNTGNTNAGIPKLPHGGLLGLLGIIKARSAGPEPLELGTSGSFAAKAKMLARRAGPAPASPVAITGASATALAASAAASLTSLTATRQQTLLAELFTVLLELFDPNLPLALAPAPAPAPAANPAPAAGPAPKTNSTVPAAAAPKGTAKAGGSPASPGKGGKGTKASSTGTAKATSATAGKKGVKLVI